MDKIQIEKDKMVNDKIATKKNDKKTKKKYKLWPKTNQRNSETPEGWSQLICLAAITMHSHRHPLRDHAHNT